MMDTKWRLLVSIFILVAGCSLGVLMIPFETTWIAVACFYASVILIPWGIIKGIVAIWDHHQENKAKE